MFKKIKEFIESLFPPASYEYCYRDREYEGIAAFGNCCGIVGGTSNTEYLSEGCIDCPHLCLIDKEWLRMINFTKNIKFRNNKNKIERMSPSTQKEINLLLLGYISHLESQIEELHKRISELEKDEKKTDSKILEKSKCDDKHVCVEAAIRTLEID